MSARRWAASIVWCGAVWTTSLAVVTVAPAAPTVVHILGAAIVIQTALTAIESEIWNGKPSFFSMLVLGIDTLINAGGTWAWISRVDATPAWTMLVDALGAPSQLGDIPKFAIALALGVLLAYAPEGIWRSG